MKTYRVNFKKAASAIFVCLFLLLSSSLAFSSPVTVAAPAGPVVGSSDNGVNVFKGIPYAKPPIGNLRFAPPQDVIPWSEVLDCTEFGDQAVQESVRIDGMSISENCLNLNIWTPKTAGAGQKLPVYVFIHGGAFASGTGADPLYDGTSFAKNGVILVTINYRLNALGFFASDETYRDYGTTGNWGILDQIKALEWVKNNISAFGGDPDNVTIGGESAGSYCVSALLLSPLAKGLFHGAIMESGTIISIAASNQYSKGNLKRSIELSNMLASSFGASDDVQGLSTLRAADANVFAQLSAIDLDFTKNPAFMMLPVYDGNVIPTDPMKALKEGNFNKVRIMLGYNDDEGSMFIPEGRSEAKYEMLASKIFGYDLAQSLLRRFAVDNENDATQRARQMLAYSMFTTGMKVYGDIFADNGLDVYLYKFDFVSEENAESGMGAMHAAELAYVFNNLGVKSLEGPDNVKLAEEMHLRWVNFIKNGNPNVGEELPTDVTWPLYDSSSNGMIFFDKNVTSGSMPDRDNMAYMQEIMFGEVPFYVADQSQPGTPKAKSSSSDCHAGFLGSSAILLLAVGFLLFKLR